ncbi:MAG: acetyl-CoA carboxylase biotin carboxylase subunit [Coriobacteriales bacterium]|jgi:acetyl-CoA carboxylase biotin carboxylase subunit|nr:acetyl-CoA carboxylase biotin carboxylase subunit [Coriobacteriales bacterium]
MFKRVLVANRGEIAARILRACREMSIETVAVFSEADRGALFTTLATQAVCIGPAPAKNSYLNQDALLTVAQATGCDAVHPGYGFLSENAGFAARVRELGITFIGPTPEVISTLGDKNRARALMRTCGVPVVPGSDGLVADADEALEIAERLGYPVLLKATSGGGGRGMRRVYAAGDLPDAFSAATAEAAACFGEDGMYLEKLIVSPRHIEVQVLADALGTTVHLGERDCTLQRNHQKVLEEAPASILSEETRAALLADALKAANAVGYTNAGTVEFVLAPDSSYYFIEMNTRIQVEHPITEMITGINIVREQLRVASGLPLTFSQDEVEFRGHAIECRINAEDPEQGFCPSPGIIDYLHLPSGFGVRVDTVLHPQYAISPFYDSMIAKLIVHGRSRSEAICRMRRALEETVVSGVTTNIPLHYMLMYNPDFISNHTDTGFLERNLSDLLRPLGDEGKL